MYVHRHHLIMFIEVFFFFFFGVGQSRRSINDEDVMMCCSRGLETPEAGCCQYPPALDFSLQANLRKGLVAACAAVDVAIERAAAVASSVVCVCVFVQASVSVCR